MQNTRSPFGLARRYVGARIASVRLPLERFEFEREYHINPPIRTLCISVCEPHEMILETFSRGQAIGYDPLYGAYVFRGYASVTEDMFDFLVTCDEGAVDFAS